MKDLLSNLSNAGWSNSVQEIENLLREEMHGTNGVIKYCRDKFESNRQSKLRSLRNDFLNSLSVEELDQQLEEYTAGIKSINLEVQHEIDLNMYNFIKFNLNGLSKLFPSTSDFVQHIEQQNDNSPAVYRAISLINKVVHASTIQSNKSNAGMAGEEFVEALLVGIGLKENEDFKRQHKSNAYSNTDFVFPWVKDYSDVEVQIFAAVQFSSNDRMRMVSGELKRGGNAYVITGSGFSASSKTLDSIGTQILEGMRLQNNRLVCRNQEIERSIESLDRKLSEKRKDGTPKTIAEDQRRRLEFLQSANVISFSDFAKILIKRFK
jgi:hypothetical protein